jgi:hypothetical protein
LTHETKDVFLAVRAARFDPRKSPQTRKTQKASLSRAMCRGAVKSEGASKAFSVETGAAFRVQSPALGEGELLA